MSIVSGTVGAILGADAQEHTADQNRQAQENVNAAQIEFQKQLLGADGKSVALPWYTNDYEQNQLFKDAQNIYRQTGLLEGTPEEQAARYKAIVAQQQGNFDASGRVVTGIFDDSLTNERLSNAAPVFRARTDLAAGQKQSVLDSLSDQLNEIKAKQSLGGFSGSSSTTENALLGARIRANQDAANVLGQVNVANATDTRGIRDAGQQLKLNSLDLPYTMTQRALALSDMPATRLEDSYRQRLGAFDFFRRPGSVPLQIQAAKLDYAPSAAQAALAGLGAGASQAADAYFKIRASNGAGGGQQAYQPYQTYPQNYWTGGAPATYNADTRASSVYPAGYGTDAYNAGLGYGGAGSGADAAAYGLDASAIY